jgi:hypothetical protein
MCLTGTEALECINGFCVQGWNNVSPEIRNKVQKTFDCCEFDVTQRHESITTTTSVPQVGCRVSITLIKLCICHLWHL